MRLMGPVLIAALAACGASNGPMTKVSVGETSYRIPAAHVRSVSSDPHQFVRIQPPESRFELVYDSRTASRRNRFGWPVIFSLNDSAAPNITLYLRGDLRIVCRKAVHPLDGCGLKVQHRDLEWTVLFPNAHSGDAHSIRERALDALRSYEG